MKRFLNYLPSRLYSFRVVPPELMKMFMPFYFIMIIVGVLSAVLVFGINNAETLSVSATARGGAYTYATWAQLLAPVGVAFVVLTYVRLHISTGSPRVFLRYASIPEKYITILLKDNETSTLISKLSNEERDIFNWIDVIDWHIKAREISKAVSHIGDKDEAARSAGLLSIGFSIDDINEFGSKQFYPHLEMGSNCSDTLFIVRAGIDADLARSFQTMSLAATT